MEQSSQQKPTDIEVMLQHIDELLKLTRCSVNTTSGQLIAVATAVECISLSQKLQRMLDRWQVYLPFREAHDVNFKRWVARLSAAHKSLDSGVIDLPEVPYILDYIDLLDARTAVVGETESDDTDECSERLAIYAPRYAPTELQADVREYVARQDEQIERISQFSAEEEQEWSDLIDRQNLLILRQQYTDYLRLIYTSRSLYSPQRYQEEVVPKAVNYLKTVANQPVMAYCLDMALSTLLDVLRQIDDLFSSTDLTSQQLQRLSLRLYFRHCPDADRLAAQEVHQWSMAWPARYRRDYALDKRAQLIDGLRQRYANPALHRYINIERPCPLSDPELGRFLFAGRLQFGIDDVKVLFTDSFLILHLNRLIDPEAAQADISAVGLSPQRKQVYARLKELVRQARWRHGMTSERVLSAFAQLLLPSQTGAPADGTSAGTADMTDLFWNLLTIRRGCETGFRSLKLTWLNLVGYFISRGVLSGGNKSLCEQFFPSGSTEGRNNDNDRNHINKGADHRAPYDFQELRPVLDRLLGLEAPK